jgi:hypothetical protein
MSSIIAGGRRGSNLPGAAGLYTCGVFCESPASTRFSLGKRRMFSVTKLRTPPHLSWVVVVAVCAGCNSVAPDKPAPDETFRDAAGIDRPKDQSTLLPWGFSSRSREIERDLGVR